MRYLIAETSWSLMSLAQELCAVGTLLSRTDRAEDLPHFHGLGSADLVIFDAALLGRDGVTLSGLRALAPHTPVALIADDPSPQQIEGWLVAGADTVIPSGCAMDETIFRLQAVARRAHGLSRPSLHFGALNIDLQRRVAHIQDCPIRLSPKLYELLEYLSLRPGRLVTRTALLSHIYGFENEPNARVFDVYMCNLRACLSATRGAVNIETVRGAGFRLAVKQGAESIAA